MTAEATALFLRMSSQPNAARKTVINTLITSLKVGAISGSNIWNKIDVLHVVAAHDSQAAILDWKNFGGAEAFNATLIGSPTFTTDRGYLNSGNTNYVSTPFAGANGVGFTLNSAHLAAWSRTATSSTDAGYDFGRAGGSRGAVGAFSLAGLFLGQLNCSTAIFTTIATGLGFSGINRPSSSAQQLYRNGALVATDSSTSTSVPLQLRVNGAAPFNREVAAWSVGGSLTANEWLDYYNALNTYLVAVGAA